MRASRVKYMVVVVWIDCVGSGLSVALIKVTGAGDSIGVKIMSSRYSGWPLFQL